MQLKIWKTPKRINQFIQQVLYLKPFEAMNKIFPFLTTLMLLSGCGTPGNDGTAGTFQFEMNFTYPGNPVFVYDHLTGDISDWWDHSFSDEPYRLFIEPTPGGGFYEIFNESGDGVLHATVIFAKRGEILRMEGPLGLSGQAVTLVCTYTLKSSGEKNTLLTLNVSGSGSFADGTPEMVKEVWEHFLWERFNPYIQDHYQVSGQDHSTLN